MEASSPNYLTNGHGAASWLLTKDHTRIALLYLVSITACTNGLHDFRGTILITSRDHELVQTVANRIIEITPNGIIDKLMSYDEYISSDAVKQQRDELYALF